MEALWAEQALTGEGWRRDVRVEIAGDGRIAQSSPNLPRRDAASESSSPRRRICTATPFSAPWPA